MPLVYYDPHAGKVHIPVITFRGHFFGDHGKAFHKNLITILPIMCQSETLLRDGYQFFLNTEFWRYSLRRNFAEGSLAATQTIVCLRGKGGNHSELNEIEFILRILREECEVTGGSSVSNVIRKK